MEYYKKGDGCNAGLIQRAFEAKGYSVNSGVGLDPNMIYFTVKGYKMVQRCSITSITAILLEDLKGPYQELRIPKFKVGDVLQDRRCAPLKETIVDIRYDTSNYVIKVSTKGEICMPFDRVDKFYDYFKEPLKLPFEVDDLVLTRSHDGATWKVNIFSHLCDSSPYFACANSTWQQCIPLEGNKDLAGTTQQCDKCYPPICYGKKNNA